MFDSESSLLYKWKNLSPFRKAKSLMVGGILLTGIATFLGILSFGFQFDAEIGYFARGAVLPVLYEVALGLLALYAIAALLLLRKIPLPRALPEPGNAGFFIACFAAFMSFFEGCFRIVTIVQTENFWGSMVSATTLLGKLSGIFDLLSVVLSFGTAIAFYLAATEKKERKGAAFFGMIPAFRCVFGVLQVFFDLTLPMNLICKLLAELALMVPTLYFLAEDRFRIGEDYVRPAWLFVASVLTVGSGAAIGFPLLFTYFNYNEQIIGMNRAPQYGEICLQAMFCVIVFAYVLVRLLAFVRSIDCPAAEDNGEKREPADFSAETDTEKEKKDEDV